MLTKIASAIKLRSTPDVYQTNDLKGVFKQCEMTSKHKLMTGLIADTGNGKTTSLKAYSMRENVFFVTVDKTMNAKGFLRAILREMQIAFDGNAHDLMTRIAKELNSLDSPLLIIDEAGKLNHIMILYLHDLREYTLANCGIILSGMPYFQRNLKRMANKQKEGYAEFYRRINIWNELKGLSREETKLICQDHGITENLKTYQGLSFADLMNKILVEQVLTDKL